MTLHIVNFSDFDDLDGDRDNGSDIMCTGDEEDEDSGGLLCVCNADLCNSYRERRGQWKMTFQ